MTSNPLWNETGYNENIEDVEMALLAHCELSWSKGALHHDASPPAPPAPRLLSWHWRTADYRISLQFKMETLRSHSSEQGGLWLLVEESAALVQQFKRGSEEHKDDIGENARMNFRSTIFLFAIFECSVANLPKMWQL